MTQTQHAAGGRKGGRVVVYGDSNCLDSTHLEKACFWLLDALLEYTMTSHVSGLLKNMNRTPYLEFPGEFSMKLKETFLDFFSFTSETPKVQRMPDNNLHTYSKVLDAKDPGSKRELTQCRKLQFESPYFLNITRSFVNQVDREPIETNII
jgi:membrane-bound transcription factor site-1 protease